MDELEQDFERENPAKKVIQCDKCRTRVVITTYAPRVHKLISRVRSLKLQRYQRLPRLLEDENEEEVKEKRREGGEEEDAEGEVEGAVGGEEHA